MKRCEVIIESIEKNKKKRVYWSHYCEAKSHASHLAVVIFQVFFLSALWIAYSLSFLVLIQ